MTAAPLDGVRVLDLSRLLPGPYCTLILAELGADVVKLEDTGGGDYLRLFPPLREGLGGAYYALNRGKRSIAIDLKQAEGRQLLLRLLPRFQVVVESFRPGVMQRLGLGYGELLAVQPQLILCSISGYGQEGPLRDRAGHDLDYQALGGTLAVTGTADGDPAVPGVQLADLAGGGLWAALRIVAALHGGGPAHLDVSMTEGAMAMLLPWFGDFAFSGEPLRRGRGLLNGGAARYRVYRAGDGRHLAVGALEPKFWRALCDVVGQDTSSGDLDPTPEGQQRLSERLQQRLQEDERDGWAERLAAADACVEPVLGMEELAHHPQHRQREMFFEIDDPRRGRSTQMRLPLGAPRATRPAPAHGEQTDEVLAEIGLSMDDLATLRGRGIVR